MSGIDKVIGLAKETYKRNDILQKTPVILSILLFCGSCESSEEGVNSSSYCKNQSGAEK